MHVDVAQARTRGRQERPVRALVLAAEQVREMHTARASYDALLPDLVSVCITEEDARCWRGDRASDTLRRSIRM